MIIEFKYGQTRKIWPSPLILSLYNPFKYNQADTIQILLWGY